MTSQIQKKNISLFAATELFEKIERLGIIADQHYFVVRLGANLVQKPFLKFSQRYNTEHETKKIIPF